MPSSASSRIARSTISPGRAAMPSMPRCEDRGGRSARGGAATAGSAGRTGCSARRRRTPASNGMNPNGFVAAASTTSSNSRPSDGAADSISFAKAMFTARNEFSSSLVNSAASGELTVCTGRDAADRPRRRDAAHAGVDAADDPRDDPLRVMRAFPGSMRSGLKATNTSVPDREPALRSSGVDHQVARAADVARRGQDDDLPDAGRCATTVCARRRERPRGPGLATRRPASARTR